MISEQQTRLPDISGIEQTVSRLVDTAKAEAVFGKPVERGEVTIIPCSEVSVGLGLGRGIAPRLGEIGRERGQGGGGGGGAKGRPVAAIIIKGSQIRIKPIVDITSMISAISAGLGFTLFSLVRQQRRRRAAQFLNGLLALRLGRMLGQRKPFSRRRRARFMRLALARS
jgi:uncharacterized spore protein YtfJ